MVAFGGASAAPAETLAEALIKAYRSSPRLEANEAALRRLDECASQARAERQPRAHISAGASSLTTVEQAELPNQGIAQSHLIWINNARRRSRYP